MRIFKDFHFEAAHRLPMVPASHKCSGLHGHNYRVRVECSGPLTEQGWVCDFAHIKDAWKGVEAKVDHKYLNEVPGLQNPTAEVIAEWILAAMKPTMIGPMVSRVTVWETQDCGAIAE